jgi:hypothetical protein
MHGWGVKVEAEVHGILWGDSGMVVSAQICLTMEFAATEVSQMSGGGLLGFFSRGHGSRERGSEVGMPGMGF